MRADELIKKYNMAPHEENGSYLEQHFRDNGEGRAASGSSLFYVGAGEYTEFHRIDCDEYWCFNAGDDLEVWIIGLDGVIEKRLFGTGEGADIFVYFPKGVIFGSRHTGRTDDGTFFTCITVPRFDYSGFELIAKAEIIKKYPEAESFWE